MYACPALRPRWADSSWPWIGRAGAAFRLFHTVSPTRTVLSRLHHAAHIRAVYASQGGSPRRHARLASRLLARPCLGRTCTCWAPISNFKKVVCLSSFPFKPDFPGARKIYGKRGLSLPWNRKFPAIGGPLSTQEPAYRGSTYP